MNKEEYLESLEEIVKDRLYLTDRIDELQKEIRSNHWSIGIDSSLVNSIKAEDFITFLHKVKKNRIKQLEQSATNMDLLFYLWFDEQSGNLNFNFINSNHESLPFYSEVELIKIELLIVQEFIKSKYHNGIPWSELNKVNADVYEERYSEIFKIKVYSEILKRNSTKAQQ